MERLCVWLLAAPAWLCALLPLWVASGGAIDVMEVLGLIAVCTPVAFLWCAFFFACLAVRSRNAWGAWASVLVVWTVALGLTVTDVPMTVRTYLSARDFQRYAESDDPDPPHYANAKYIGLFHVKKVWRHGRTVAFGTDGKLFDVVGVIYAPDGLPTDPLPIEAEELSRACYTHLYGPWYRFEIAD